MANNPYVTKLVHVSEEAAPVVHVPVIVGNELFVLTQQDIRRVEDIRVLSYSRVAPNGQLFPLSAGTTNLFDSGGSMPISLPPAPNFCTLQDMIAHCSPNKVRTHIDEDLNSANDTPASQQQTPCRNPKTVASVTTQLGWSKLDTKSCAMFPPRTINESTSTCSLMTSTGCQHCPVSQKCHSSCQTLSGPPTKPNPSPNRKQDASCQTTHTTASAACNTSGNHIVWKSSTPSNTSDECELMSEEDPKAGDWRRGSLTQTCTDREIMARQQRSILRKSSASSKPKDGHKLWMGGPIIANPNIEDLPQEQRQKSQGN